MNFDLRLESFARRLMNVHLGHSLSCGFADYAAGENDALRLFLASICFSNSLVDDHQRLFWKGFENKREGQSRE